MFSFCCVCCYFQRPRVCYVAVVVAVVAVVAAAAVFVVFGGAAFLVAAAVCVRPTTTESTGNYNCFCQWLLLFVQLSMAVIVCCFCQWLLSMELQLLLSMAVVVCYRVFPC